MAICSPGLTSTVVLWFRWGSPNRWCRSGYAFCRFYSVTPFARHRTCWQAQFPSRTPPPVSTPCPTPFSPPHLRRSPSALHLALLKCGVCRHCVNCKRSPRCRPVARLTTRRSSFFPPHRPNWRRESAVRKRVFHSTVSVRRWRREARRFHA